MMVELRKLCWELGGLSMKGGCPDGAELQGAQAWEGGVGQTDWSGVNGGGRSNQTGMCGRVSIAE